MDGVGDLAQGLRSVEVVGFGALNVDYIASASRLSAGMTEQVSESTARFEWNTEGPVDAATIARAIERLGTSSLDASLGGSAWLTPPGFWPGALPRRRCSSPSATTS